MNARTQRPFPKKTPPKPIMPRHEGNDPRSDDEPVSKEPALYYVPGKWYTITVCPEDQCESDPNRWKTLCTRIHAVHLSAFASCAHFKYNVEISEPRDRVPRFKIPRIHSHGRFMLPTENSVRQFLLFGLFNVTQLGLCEIDTCADAVTWDTYCAKQRTITGFDTVEYTPAKQREKLPFNVKQVKNKPGPWERYMTDPELSPTDSDA